jgi:hypothetical protein
MLATNPFVAGELSLMNIAMKTMPATINKVSTVIRKSGQCCLSSVVPMPFSLLASRGLCLIIAASICRATAAHTAPTASLNSSCRSTCQGLTRIGRDYPAFNYGIIPSNTAAAGKGTGKNGHDGDFTRRGFPGQPEFLDPIRTRGRNNVDVSCRVSSAHASFAPKRKLRLDHHTSLSNVPPPGH